MKGGQHNRFSQTKSKCRWKLFLKKELHETVSLKKEAEEQQQQKEKKIFVPTAKKEEQFEQLQIFVSGNSIRRNREIGATEHLTDGQPNYRGTVCALCKVEWMIHSEKKD